MTITLTITLTLTSNANFNLNNPNPINLTLNHNVVTLNDNPKRRQMSEMVIFRGSEMSGRRDRLAMPAEAHMRHPQCCNFL